MKIEMVERKGLGHPDTLADAIAEETSRRYSSYCLDRFGAIAHHWFDKVMLIGGESNIGYQTARMIRPVRAILVGKAVRNVGREEIPLAQIFQESVRQVFNGTLKNLDFDGYCICELHVNDGTGPGQSLIRYRPKSPQEIRQFEAGRLVSNDCNLCVGFAPYTKTEALSLDVEQFLLSPRQQEKWPWLGSDIKTIVNRLGNKTSLLANVPMLALQIGSFQAYLELRRDVELGLREFCSDYVGSEVDVTVNPEWIHGRAYLTVTGTCLDTGDIGVVGRGNRHSGLITPMRSMSIEASAGKNPLDHTGKLLNVAASMIAKQVHGKFDIANTVYIFAKKGDVVTNPSILSIHCDGSASIPDNFQRTVLEVAKDTLSDIDSIRESILTGSVRLY